MTRSEERYVDKSEWRAGPWMNEPDRVEWRHAGLPCLIVRGPSGALCGYVGLPPEHPMHGKSYDDVRRADGDYPEVHGGLTYAEPCQDPPGRICHVPLDGEPDNVWWLGFDCAHGGDYMGMKWGAPYLAKLDAEGRRLFDYDPGRRTDWGDTEEYRDIAYVTREVESLADQMALHQRDPLAAGGGR